MVVILNEAKDLCNSVSAMHRSFASLRMTMQRVV